MARWQQFDRREQGLLLLAAAVVTLLLLWLLVLQPLRGMVTGQQDSNRILASGLQQAQGMAAELKQLKSSTKNSGAARNASLQRLVGQSLNSHGLGMSSFTPNSDNTVSLRFEQAPFNTLMKWLYQMEASHNISVDSLTVNPTGDSGIVKVSVRLRGNG